MGHRAWGFFVWEIMQMVKSFILHAPGTMLHAHALNI
jgi:hypothetical protein